LATILSVSLLFAGVDFKNAVYLFCSTTSPVYITMILIFIIFFNFKIYNRI